MMSPTIRTVRIARIFPEKPLLQERAEALSLLDATTANFGTTNAVWFYERPTVQQSQGASVVDHLRTSLSVTLTAYPQWCGHLKSIDSIDGTAQEEARSFPAHARRFGRVYVHYGTSDDPGVDFIEATSSVTLDSIHSPARTQEQPLWNRDDDPIAPFVSPSALAHALETNEPDSAGLRKALIGVQCTQLACGSVAVAVKIEHPLADITSLTAFVRDWASISRAMFAGDTVPSISPLFAPKLLDSLAKGDINADSPNPIIINQAESLPLHRYDWWALPQKIPGVFREQNLPLAGKVMPWAEWDTKVPVSVYTLHLNREQVEHLWQACSRTSPPGSSRISKHDAVLAHVWSCVMRARRLQDDQGPVHCDLVLGTRPGLQLDQSFMGSPTMMLNAEMPATDVAGVDSASALGPIARQIRQTISTVNNRECLGAHLYSIAYEKSPQRIWQAFLGRRHILMTTWARAGIYGIDFGFGSRIRYVDGVIPKLDGCLIMKEAPPNNSVKTDSSGGWTDNGVDVALHLCVEDMQRLLKDLLLLPSV